MREFHGLNGRKEVVRKDGRKEAREGGQVKGEVGRKRLLKDFEKSSRSETGMGNVKVKREVSTLLDTQ